MDFTEEFMQSLQSMDKKRLNKLLQSATRSLTKEQQQKLRQLSKDPQGLEELKQKISAEDIEDLKANMSSPEQLRSFIQNEQTRKRIDQLFERD